MNNPQRNFKGVWIPADIWLNTDLSIQEKIMLVEIDSLCACPERGCWAANEHFAKFFGLSKSRISEVISSLADKGYIRVSFQRKGKQIVERNIFMLDPFGKCEEPLRETLRTPSGNAKESNTESNTESIKTSSSSDDDAAAIDNAFEAFWKAGMRKVGKQKAKTIFKRKLKESKQAPHEFAAMLINDVKARIELQQMGFDKLHPERYLSNQRWEDEYADDRQQQKQGRQQLDWNSDFINDPNRLEL